MKEKLKPVNVKSMSVCDNVADQNFLNSTKKTLSLDLRKKNKQKHSINALSNATHIFFSTVYRSNSTIEQ